MANKPSQGQIDRANRETARIAKSAGVDLKKPTKDWKRKMNKTIKAKRVLREMEAKKRAKSAVSGLKKGPNRSSDEERKRTLAKTTQRRYDSPGEQLGDRIGPYTDQTRAFDKNKPKPKPGTRKGYIIETKWNGKRLGKMLDTRPDGKLFSKEITENLRKKK